MLIKTRNSIYQLTHAANQYTLVKLEALLGQPATMSEGRVWTGNSVTFDSAGCLCFYVDQHCILRTSIISFVEA